MSKINELLNAILEEANKQKERREEYLSLVHTLVDSLERKDECTWKLSFRWYSDSMGGEMISFSQNISGRNTGLSSYDVGKLEDSRKEIDKCVNYLLDCGEEEIDSFIEHLSKVAIPQFLQGRFPKNYEISRNTYSGIYTQ